MTRSAGWLGMAAGVWLAAGAALHGAEAIKPQDKAAADARWSDLSPLVIHTPFDNCRYPHLDAQGSVLFIADDTVSRESKGGHHGIYRYGSDGTLVCLVRAGETTVPGEEATITAMQGLQTDENAVDFIFNAADNANGHGLYHWSKGGLDTIARAGRTVLPGDTQPITSVEYGSLQGGRILYKATAPHLGASLVLHDLADGTDRVLCHAGMAIPGRAGETFRSMGSTNWINADSVVFRGGSSANPRERDSKGTAGVYGWFGVQDWSAAGQDLAPERLRAVVDGTTAVPVPDVPDGAKFNVFGSAPAGGGFIGFEASGDGFNGIFAARTPGGPISCVVSNHTGIDVPFKGRFTSFGSYPSVVGPNLVFTAEASAEDNADAVDDDGAEDARGGALQTYRGVFVYRLDRGELFALTDNRVPLVGKEVAGYEIGGHVLAGDRFAVTVTFADRSSQVFSGTIRPEAFRQLNGDAAAKKPDGAR